MGMGGLKNWITETVDMWKPPIVLERDPTNMSDSFEIIDVSEQCEQSSGFLMYILILKRKKKLERYNFLKP